MPSAHSIAPYSVEAAAEQPEITIVNLDAESGGPSIFRCSHPSVSSPATLARLARWLEDENALIVNLTVTPGHLCLVTALGHGWVNKFQTAVHGNSAGQEG